MSTTEPLTLKRNLEDGFDVLMERVPDALAKEGFGVLTEIDMQGTLKTKLGVDFRRYHIFGACHPDSAHRILSSELDVGVLLPCNVVIYEADDGAVTVAAVNPLQQLAGLSDDPALIEVARGVHDRLERTLKRVAGEPVANDP